MPGAKIRTGTNRIPWKKRPPLPFPCPAGPLRAGPARGTASVCRQAGASGPMRRRPGRVGRSFGTGGPLRGAGPADKVGEGGRRGVQAAVGVVGQPGPRPVGRRPTGPGRTPPGPRRAAPAFGTPAHQDSDAVDSAPAVSFCQSCQAPSRAGFSSPLQSPRKPR